MKLGPTRSKCFIYFLALSIRLTNDLEVRIPIPSTTKVAPRPTENIRIMIIPYPTFPIEIAANRTARAEGQGISPPEKANQNAWPVVCFE